MPHTPIVKSYRTKGKELQAAYRELERLSKKLLMAEKQRDDLLAACEAALAYRDKAGPLNFQLEKMDDFFRDMRLAVAKANGANRT